MKKLIIALLALCCTAANPPTSVTVPIQVISAITFTPSPITFSGISVGTSSSPLIVTVKNISTTTIPLGSISFSGGASSDYSQTNDCSTSIAASATCHINITFSPSVTGTRITTLNIAAVGGHTYTASVNGSTTASNLVFSPSSFSFSQILVGATSNPTTFTVTNNGTATASISSISVTGTNASEFSETTDCSSTLIAGALCHIVVTFAPKSSGNKTASIQIATSIGGPYIALLSGSASTSGSGGVCP